MCLIIFCIVMYFEILSLSVCLCVRAHMCICEVCVYVSNRQPDNWQLCLNLHSASGLTDETSWTFLGKHAVPTNIWPPYIHLATLHNMASLHTYGIPTNIRPPYIHLAALCTYGYPTHMTPLHPYDCPTYLWLHYILTATHSQEYIGHGFSRSSTEGFWYLPVTSHSLDFKQPLMFWQLPQGRLFVPGRLTGQVQAV